MTSLLRFPSPFTSKRQKPLSPPHPHHAQLSQAWLTVMCGMVTCRPGNKAKSTTKWNQVTLGSSCWH